MPKQRFTNESLKEVARELLAERGNELTLDQFCDEVGLSHTTAIRRLGGWCRFRKSLGLPARGRCGAQRKYTHEIILERLRRIAHSDPMITRTEFTRWTGITGPTIAEYFGSWTRLREHADLPSGRRKSAGYSEDALMREFNRVVIELSRLPRSKTEFFRWSRISCTPYQRCYGNWKAVVGEYRKFLSRVGQGRQGIACEIPDTRSLYSPPAGGFNCSQPIPRGGGG